MEHPSIISVVTALFKATDARNWQQVENCFANEVLLDYTSMAGGEPVTLAPTAITTAWKQLLPGFDSTNHELSDFKVSANDNTATVTNSGHATHYLTVDGHIETWIVDGDYLFELTKQGENWEISAMKFTVKNISGNMKLPELAAQKVANLVQ